MLAVAQRDLLVPAVVVEEVALEQDAVDAVDVHALALAAGGGGVGVGDDVAADLHVGGAAVVLLDVTFCW